MDPKNVSWNDIERALSQNNLESLDRETLEAMSRVQPPPSGNPAFHLRFQDAKQRIYRILDQRQAATPISPGPLVPPAPVPTPEEPVSPSPLSSMLRGQHGLPSSQELQELPATFRQALIFRCALRVLPVLASRGAFQFWEAAYAQENAECFIRAMQAGLINCTDNTSRNNEEKQAAATAEQEARRARRTARSDDGRIKAAMTLVALSANGGDAGKADLVLDLLLKHRQFYPGLAAAVAADFTALLEESRGNGRWPAPSFFTRKLWPLDPPEDWASDGASLNIALHTAGIAWAAGEFEGWKAGRFEVARLIRSLVEWAGRVPDGDGRDAGGVDPEEDDAAFAESDLRTLPPHGESHFGNDAVTKQDTLSRRRLARVIAGFLRDPRTQRPLTLSVEGPWGSGKTTFMGLLEAELSDGPQPIRTIWFNPWRHQTQEELWAAFALKVTEEIAGRFHWRDRWRRWWRFHTRRFDWKEGWWDMLLFTGRALVWLVAVVSGVALVLLGVADVKDDEFLKAFMWGVGGVTTVLLALSKGWKEAVDVIGSPFEIDLKRHLAKPNYAEKASFLAEFQSHFRDFCEVYIARGETIAICIDDLDRCDAPKAAELMQAINLMLSDDAPFIYILGMDRAKVAAGIAVKSSELLPFLYARELAAASAATQEDALRTRGLEYGYEFIEKFIQLPFRLPPSERADVRSFIRGRLTLRTVALTGSPAAAAGTLPVALAEPATQAPAALPAGTSAGPAPTPAAPVADESHLEAPLLFATRILEGNPRRIAQLINLVRLQRRLAPILGVVIADGQLAKWTAIALRWPLFILDLGAEPSLLKQLVDGNEPTSPSARFIHWRGIPDFVNFARAFGPPDDFPENYRLNSAEVIEALLRLGITVPLVDDGKALARALANRLQTQS